MMTWTGEPLGGDGDGVGDTRRAKEDDVQL